jgi:signal transduction histidine kinase
VLTISDNGVGFDPETVKRGSGLDNMAQRTEALGGSLKIDSSPGRGMTLTATLPH